LLKTILIVIWPTGSLYPKKEMIIEEHYPNVYLVLTRIVLASNNFRDVRYYVKLYGLKHIATHHIIHKAVNDGILSNAQTDEIWKQMVAKRRQLHFSTFVDYLNSL
jgi:hypothetical protein